MLRTSAGRVIAIAVLLAVAVVGLRGFHPHADPGRRVSSAPYLVLFAGFEVAGVAGLVVLLWRRPAARRRRKSPQWRMVVEPLHGRWARLLALLLAVTVIVGPIALAVIVAAHHQTAPSPPRPAVTVGPIHQPTGPGNPWWFASLTVAVAVAVIALAAAAWSRRRTPSASRAAHPLALALIAGQQALRSTENPRDAVIACYGAMEQALTEEGVGPHDADTPTQVLARAAGVVNSPQAATLTRLFREARYSRHPMDERHRDVARRALELLHSDLAGVR